MNKFFVYSPKESPRLEYVLNWLFKEHYPAVFKIVSSLNELPKDSVVLNYSNLKIPSSINSLQVEPSGLLFQTGLDETMNKFNAFEKLKTNSGTTFDVLSAIFFMLSRYEEYVVDARDSFGRFTFRHATTFGDFSWLSPVCDIWASDLVTKMNQNLGLNLTHQKSYLFLPTFDIDIAFAYRFKGFTRTAGSLVKKLFKADYGDLFKHLKFLLTNSDDPFDTYDLIADAVKNRNYLFFVHMGNYGNHDISLDWNNEKYKETFISKLKGNYDLGIHPSLLSNTITEKLNDEWLKFETSFGQKPKKSRQHYLVLKLPHTYRSLIKLGIEEDYSLGFAETIGFRAGTCSPFYWYDLLEEKQTPLKLFPQTFMERSLTKYMKLNDDDATKATKQHIDLIKKHKGTFTPIWHNSTINENSSHKMVFNLMFEHGI
ncbi:MAG: polysaccharide deacetylase family protein [Cytophagales bacterium]